MIILSTSVRISLFSAMAQPWPSHGCSLSHTLSLALTPSLSHSFTLLLHVSHTHSLSCPPSSNLSLAVSHSSSLSLVLSLPHFSLTLVVSLTHSFWFSLVRSLTCSLSHSFSLSPPLSLLLSHTHCLPYLSPLRMGWQCKPLSWPSPEPPHTLGRSHKLLHAFVESSSLLLSRVVLGLRRTLW